MSRAGRYFVYAAMAVAVVSAVLMAFQADWDSAFRFALIFALMVAARSRDVPSPFVGAFAVFILLATWATAAQWYREIWWSDIVIHFFAPGSTAAVLYFLFADARLVPDVRQGLHQLRPWSPAFLTLVIGTTTAVVWEFYEAVVEQVAPQFMLVGYADTIIDLLAGALGSLAAGALVVAWSRRRDAERQ